MNIRMGKRNKKFRNPEEDLKDWVDEGNFICIRCKKRVERDKVFQRRDPRYMAYEFNLDSYCERCFKETGK